MVLFASLTATGWLLDMGRPREPANWFLSRSRFDAPQSPSLVAHCSLAHSLLACLRMGISGSACFREREEILCAALALALENCNLPMVGRTLRGRVSGYLLWVGGPCGVFKGTGARVRTCSPFGVMPHQQ